MASRYRGRAIAYEKSGRWFTAEEPFLRAKERTDAGSSALRHPRSELIAPLPQEVEPAFNNRKLHMRLPCAQQRLVDDSPDGEIGDVQVDAGDVDRQTALVSIDEVPGVGQRMAGVERAARCPGPLVRPIDAGDRVIRIVDVVGVVINRVQFETRRFQFRSSPPWATLEGWYYGFQTGRGLARHDADVDAAAPGKALGNASAAVIGFV